jgi:hypothetical protein
MGSQQRFLFVLLKPSDYGDDSYVIQFLRSAIRFQQVPRVG